MKNRVAAQVSRDRKKAKFETMESSLELLLSANQKLSEECDSLKYANQKLQAENEKLRKRISGNYQSLKDDIGDVANNLKKICGKCDNLVIKIIKLFCKCRNFVYVILIR